MGSGALLGRAFALLVLKAEGFLQPEYEPYWIRRLSRRFREHFAKAAATETKFSN